MREQPLLLLALRGRHELAVGLLLGPQVLVPGQRGTSARVGVEHLVDEMGRVTTRDLAGTHDVGVLPQESQIDHGPSLSTRPRVHPAAPPG